LTELVEVQAAQKPALSPRVLVAALRPRQWTKNLALFAALLFARKLLDVGSVAKAAMAAVSFSLLAGGIYILNDWVDREKDRLHPEKKHRPIASGALSTPAAFTFLIGVWLVGGTLAFRVNTGFFTLALSYLIMQVAYSFLLKQAVILDIVVIALGFVMRVVGGGVAIGVPVSNWLYLCTLLLALFLGFAKRRHELSSLEDGAHHHRPILSEYSVPMLDQMMSVVAAACIVAYGLYTVAPETVVKVGSDRLKFTVPMVVYGIFRYLFLIHKKNLGGSPERVLLSDVPLLLDIALFVGVAGAVLYLPG
jgi:4-hydroxybenzoate polyprenyltransferase